MKTKPISPYQRLLQEFKEWVNQAIRRENKIMWTYTTEELHRAWFLTNLKERVGAAQQLGFDVQLKSTDKGLEVWYVKKLPQEPLKFIWG